MHAYLITPHHSLGSDSFFVIAHSLVEARERALAKIAAEDWNSRTGWEIYEYLDTFEEPSA